MTHGEKPSAKSRLFESLQGKQPGFPHLKKKIKQIAERERKQEGEAEKEPIQVVSTKYTLFDIRGKKRQL